MGFSSASTGFTAEPNDSESYYIYGTVIYFLTCLRVGLVYMYMYVHAGKAVSVRRGINGKVCIQA